MPISGRTLESVQGASINSLSYSNCEAISSNFITVNRLEADAATINSGQGESITVCIDDVEDILSLSNTFNIQNLEYWYVITDENDLILDWITDNEIELNATGVGVWKIWGWKFLNSEVPTVGDNISSLSDDSCESISSNFMYY